MTGGQLYREKFKPPTIQYIEEHFAEFKNFMENMSPEYVEHVKTITENYVSYIAGMSSKVATYLEQTIPLRMNCERTITTLPGDATFILGGSVAPVGLIDANFSNLAKAFLLIIGRAVNIYAGQNNLDCSVLASDNQWMMSVAGGVYADLQNGVTADGQMLDTDWECMVQGAIHPFTFMFDITDRLTALNNTLGVRLAIARARQDSLIVTVDVYLKVVWKL